MEPEIPQTQIRVSKHLADYLKNVGDGTYNDNLQGLLESAAFVISDENIALLQTQHKGLDLNDAVKAALDTQEQAAMQREADEVNALEKSVKALYPQFREKGFGHADSIERASRIMVNSLKATGSSTDLVSLLTSLQVAIIFNKKGQTDVRN